MSDLGGDDVNGPEALTPFEFALAGVEPPGSGTRSSLQVIDDMRALIDGMDDIPVTHHGLQDFLDAGGLVARQRERRRRRPRQPATPIADRAESGSFIDITPPDMGAPVEKGGHEVAAVATADLGRPIDRANGSGETDQAAPTDPTTPPDDREPIDVVQAELRSVLAQPMPLVDDVDDLAEEPITGPIAEHRLEQLPTGPMAAGVSDDVAPAGNQVGGDDAADVDADADEEEVSDLGAGTGAAEAATLASTTARLRDRLGRFGPIRATDPDRTDWGATDPALPIGVAAASVGPVDAADEPDGSDEPTVVAIFGPTEDGSERAAAASIVGVAAPGLLEETSASGPPLATPAPASTPTIATSAGHRPGGAILALVGAGAAAAVLVAGSLWWATSNASSSTGTEGGDAEVAAAPSTTTGELAAGSMSGPAERSTGDDAEPVEFQDDEDARSSSTATASTIRAEVGAERSGSTAGRSTTTTPRSGNTDATPGVTVATTGAVSTTEAGSTSTTRAATTAPPTTRTPATTVRPATTTTIAPERPVSIGGRVTVGDDGGPGLGAVEVSLYTDQNRDRRVERRIARRNTAADGSYSFDEAPGCYEVRFTAPTGYRIPPDASRQYLCLESAAATAGTDAIAERLTSDPPSGCLVEEDASYAGLGVEVYETASNWAPSYTFYDRSGGVVVRTRDLGPFDTDGDDPTDREWFGAENGFDHRSVWSVAAERDGIESAPITCRRD